MVIVMDRLTTEERSAILKIAAALPEAMRGPLLEDLDKATVRPSLADRSILEFEIPGYQRPEPGQQPYPVEGQVLDIDRERLEVVLYYDRNGRLLEFELIRYDSSPVLGPVWSTFKIVG
jgi:hypothetical protein